MGARRRVTSSPGDCARTGEAFRTRLGQSQTSKHSSYPQKVRFSHPHCNTKCPNHPVAVLEGVLLIPAGLVVWTNRPGLYNQVMTKTHIALYAGSFDPITNGHLDVIRRGCRLFDEIVVGVGQNPDKRCLFSIDDRTAMATELVKELSKDCPEASRIRVQSYEGLTVEFARSIGATALLRGLRNATDTATECQLALANRHVADIETVFILPSQAFGFTSSSLIRQIVALGGDLRTLEGVVPRMVIDRLEAVQPDASGKLRGREMEGTWGVD